MLTVLLRLFVLLIVFTSFNTHAAAINCQAHDCIAVIDAGSTGSRLHIYAYDLDAQKTPINIKEFWSKKIKPGIATIEANKTTIESYLGTLFSDAPVVDKIPVYFYATAGMRLLTKPKQDQYYGLLKDWFAHHAQWQLKSAKTISGQVEGLYGWLAVNYQLGLLSASTQPLVGVMDMGGASVQITFPLNQTEGVSRSDLQEFDVYGRHIKLFVHSFLGLGQTEVSNQYLDKSSCFAQDYELPSGLLASGDAYVCAKEVELLLNHVHRVDQIIQPVLLGNQVSDWYVTGGMAALAQSSPFKFTEHQFTSESILAQANAEVCQQNWSELNTKYANNEYIHAYCLFPAYYYALMVDSYGINPKLPIHYLKANQSLDWTLGAIFFKQ